MRFTACTLAIVLASCGDEPSSGNATEAGGGPEYGAVGGSNAAPPGETPAGSGNVAAGGSTSSSGGEMNAEADGAPVVGSAGGASSSSAGNGSTPGAQAASGAAGGGASGGAIAGSGGDTGSVFPDGVTRPRIMIVGDSISAGPGCYKRYLLANLQQNGYASFDFVGEYTDDCGGGVRHSAVSCSTALQYTQPSFSLPNCAVGMSFPGMSALAATHRPDLVMLQLGVNDVWGGRAEAAILADFGQLVAQARAVNPSVVVVVAQIAKIRPDCSADDSIERRAELLVDAVPAWAAAQSQPGSPVLVADLWTNSDWSQAETLDCVHPNDTGAQRMGQNWFNALAGILPRE